ncbi:DUF1858 domain-containing protein [Texcoconibacillus texcoconensis]|uniref:DUF1858 domain-containing protein n=1 Tax=Texcoconibacillus texcoconensis TaxID=1095777 RepID=A0A840QPY0_9BACI|nr:DUF1858 domain-containing protein [Texcoconibacillus texcoconensis]MBB5173391.1 hypothetical protein [Texcoconibacillus texcoconensis]
MEKQLSLKRSVYELSTDYPEIIDIMVELGFENMTKPGMLQSVGRVMTIPKGCRVKNIPLQKVTEAFQANGFTIID